MQLSFELSNTLGCVYRKGNVIFSHDGDYVFSPVGNCVNVHNLKDNSTEALNPDSNFNIKVLALDFNGSILLAINKRGVAILYSLICHEVLYRLHLNKPIRDAKFSPDGKKLAICRDNDVQIYRAPEAIMNQVNPFYLEEVYHISSEATTFIDWSSDSNLIAIGSKDMQTRVCGSKRFENIYIYTLAGHIGPIVACFFLLNSFDLITLDKSGFLVQWECSIDATKLQAINIDTTHPDYLNRGDVALLDGETITEAGTNVKSSAAENKLYYKKIVRRNFHQSNPGSNIYLTCADYDKASQLLVTGFSNGIFVLYEMPEFNMIQSLSVSDQPIRTVKFNKGAAWLAIGCGESSVHHGQLIVWEWKSESYILRQQGHSSNMQTIAYSFDGRHIASGGLDGKVKLWDVQSGHCFVTFEEHTGPVNGICFTQHGRALISASSDGTIRAFDLKRYRNFRTFVSPRPVQFGCVAVDSNADFVAACGQSDELYEIYLWAIQTGRLLEVLDGHEAPICGLNFCAGHDALASCGWDKTLRIWEVVEGKNARETIELKHEGLAVEFSPNGQLLAVATLDCEILFYDWREGEQNGSIEAKLDLDPGRAEAEQIKATTAARNKCFTTICFSADSEYLIAGGQTRFVCIYNVAQCLIVKKILTTCNLSLDAVADDIDRRRLTEFGNLALIDESDSDIEDDDPLAAKKQLKLPGVRSGDLSQRSYKPEVRVSCARFSPTGRAFAICSTEGLSIYSVEKSRIFNPYSLESSITPDSVLLALKQENYLNALMTSLKLGDKNLQQKVLETTPIDQIEFISRDIHPALLDRMLQLLAAQLLHSVHCELYLRWTNAVLLIHAHHIKSKADRMLPVLTSLQQSLTRHRNQLSTICEHNKYSLLYIKTMQQAKLKNDDASAKRTGGDDDSNDILMHSEN